MGQSASPVNDSIYSHEFSVSLLRNILYADGHHHAIIYNLFNTTISLGADQNDLKYGPKENVF